MLNILLERIRQKRRTVAYPLAPPVMPERFRGMPVLDASRCGDGCRLCADACPTGAIDVRGGGMALDMGRCLFCQDCVAACPAGAIEFTGGYSLASNTAGGLVTGSGGTDGGFRRAEALGEELVRLLGRSLRLRQVSAGGCNACEADANVLTTVVFDIGRFGIDFVASPRHADGLLVTGPVTSNMRMALEKTYRAVPTPKIVIASGACAISGGPYRGMPEVKDGVGDILPVDLYVPGCPPHPYTLLEGMLRLLGRIR